MMPDGFEDEKVDVAAFVLVLPIRRGTEEKWRRFAQDLLGSGPAEYEGFRRRLGIDGERAWISRTPGGEVLLVRFEAENTPRGLARRLAASEEPFDAWFKETVREIHDHDPFSWPPGEPAPESIFP